MVPPCVAQDLDEDYLVVWDGFGQGVRWRQLSVAALRAFLIERVSDGFVFPLNPKWILCDAGWYEVFAALRDTPSAHQALDAWLPPSSGLREHIERVHTAHPHGFVRVARRDSLAQEPEIHSDMARAELAIQRDQTLRRAKMKLRCSLRWLAIARESQKRRAEAAGGACGGGAPVSRSPGAA